MKKNSTLNIYHLFPKPNELSDNIEDHFQYWRTLKIDGLTSDEITFLGAMGSTTNKKSKIGNLFFEINPLYQVEEDDEGVEEYIDTHKACIVFKPAQDEYHLKNLIQHTDAKVMSGKNRAISLINRQKNVKEFPNNISPLHINPAVILGIKKELIQFFTDMSSLELETKRGPRRACWKNDKGYYYLGICPVDYAYPPTKFE